LSSSAPAARRRGAAGALDRLGVGRNVGVEILEPQQIAGAGAPGCVGDGAHAVDADAGDVFEAPGACAGHAPS